MTGIFKISFLFLFCGIVAIEPSSAQRILTLDEALATALQNNFEIQLARNDSMVASIDYSYRNAVFLPTLNANATLANNNNQQKQTLADDSKRSGKIKNQNLQTSLGMNWVLFDGLKMFIARDKAEAILEAGSYTIKEQVVNTIANVIGIYYNIARQEQLIKATHIQITLNEDRAKLAQYRLDIGTGAKPDVLQSKVDLNEQKARKMQQETFVQQLKEQLVQAMNSKIQSQEFMVPDSIPVNESIVLGDLQEGINQTNPSLLLARTRIAISTYTLKESLASRWPILNFNAAYNFNRNTNQIAINPFSTKLNQVNGFNYGFGMSIPIFNQFRVQKQIKQDKLTLDFQKLAYENQRSLLLLYMTNRFQDYQQQKKQLKLEEENILLAQENVNILYQSYQWGHATLLQLREAQLSLAQAYDRLIAARYNTKLAETELMRLKGDLLYASK